MSMESKKIMELRRRIPPTTGCPKDCHECCGPVAFSRWEWSRVEHRAANNGLICPYLGEKGCEIYAERPIICRLFGLKGGEGPLHCGKKDIFARNLFEITTSEIEKIGKEYIKILLEYGTFGPFFRYE